MQGHASNPRLTSSTDPSAQKAAPTAFGGRTSPKERAETADHAGRSILASPPVCVKVLLGIAAASYETHPGAEAVGNCVEFDNR